MPFNESVTEILSLNALIKSFLSIKKKKEKRLPFKRRSKKMEIEFLFSYPAINLHEKSRFVCGKIY